VINALKHAFPDDKADGQIVIAYDSVETNWKLTVSENGIGKATAPSTKPSQG
jgi:two-component sensor histidine kinase